MRKLILLSALLASGCDDPEALETASSLLQFGVVQAKIVCLDIAPMSASPSCDPQFGINLAFYRLADGGAFVTSSDGVTDLIGRSESNADDMATPTGSGTTFAVSGGELVASRDGCSPVPYDIETECTGYNLEAFGVD